LPGIEVGGQVLVVMFATAGPYRAVIEKAMAKHALWGFRPEGWYALDVIIGILDTIGEIAGSNTLFAMGNGASCTFVVTF
jgi:hypothetical protein